ncbi:uncharacterized protein TRIADDRAFT_60879 [Trichoplax adhaerens]|uniref:ABC transporter domain-containing protein n=1 Tax=Trichoplax adhaerens TaxID=10228 RepID=B3S9E7_TRIAD|nr:hypothetical protein TRIADDRAFT_60879 [Trichoplax adhaerens]EDV20637.1 hypothetical protein TRIADDRAFT_60879 [Trichoplax adhaerens]|eukprot:XP_002116837.1 hypothetical protein TRIADDRAFT_60879 [Trichoplax adhaerens]
MLEEIYLFCSISHADLANQPSISMAITGYTVSHRHTVSFCRRNLTEKYPSIACPVNGYLSSGFALLQNAIDRAITQIAAGIPDSFPESKFQFQLMPKGSFTSGIGYLQIFISIYYVMAYSPFVNFLLVGLVTEKEKKIKEGMKMMGLRTTAFWLSWFITYALTILVTTIVVTIISSVANLYKLANPFIIFLLIFLYGLSIITFSFMLTPLFNKATVAGGIGSLATIAFTALYFPITLLPTTPVAKWLLSLLSPVALALSLSQAIALETTVGVQFNNLWVGEFPIGGGLLMLGIDIFLYLLLAIYFDMIVPKEYGQTYHPLFCFSPSFWSGNTTTPGVAVTESSNISKNADVEDISADYRGKEAIRITGITKTFIDSSSKNKKAFNAVDNFHLDVYEGQITALLGHNGAGKTTLIAALTGLLPTTSGTAHIYDYDINKPEEMMKIREITGVCPQQDILFDTLSVREHLVVFATIKGIPNDQIDEAVNKTLDDILLTEKASTRATDLSGGQKRKLCVGIALIGDPKVVYLDEPTSGMDPLSRRQIWALLQSRREGRVTLLTTHFMDEADILADRKAVVSKGKLRCAGSSLFLKNRFGIGYHLGMVGNQDSNIDKISRVVHDHIPKATLQRSHAGEISYLLPLSDVRNFPDLFAHLESPANEGSSVTCAQDCGVSSYGISMTTLEEVFLKLKDDATADDLTSVNKSPMTGASNDEEGTTHESTFDFRNINRLSGRDLIRQQFKSLLKIRFLINRRDPLAVFFRLMLPPVFIILGLVFANNITSITNTQRDPPTINLAPNLYVNGTLPPSRLLNSKLLIRNSTFGQINLFLSNMQASGLYYQMSNLSADYLLDNYPHTLGYDVLTLQNTTAGISSDIGVMYNDTALHSIPIAINIINQMRYNIEMMKSKGTAAGSAAIHVASKPFPKLQSSGQYNAGAFSAPLFIGLALNIIPAGFAIEIVRDRKNNVRQLLRASGVTSGMYWFSTLACDFLSYCVPVILMLIMIPILRVASFTVPAAMGALFLTTISYMSSNILFSYASSFLFSSVDTCQSVLPPLFNLALLLPTIGVSMLDMFGQTQIALIIHFVMVVINPVYPIGGAVYYIGQVYARQIFISDGKPISANAYFSPSSPIPYCILLHILSRLVVAVQILSPVYLVNRYHYTLSNFNRVVQGNQISKNTTQPSSEVTDATELISNAASMSADDDVRDEYQRLKSSSSGNDVLSVRHLRKEFIKRPDVNDKRTGCCNVEKKKMAAVEDLYFGVAPGEVFGLLGPNGAGKTTTLNIITGDMSATRGEVCIAGQELASNITHALRSLGFCPQHDALWERVTLHEHLTTYAAIKGIPLDQIEGAVSRFISGMDLQDHRDKFSKNLSGGTKRKLSFGMSIIGCPKLLLMDEPSTGLDPGAKRFLWNAISASITGETGAVITTHSMEEADALCSRVGIMVGGQLRCLGSTQHLKNKYGGGYHLDVKFSLDVVGSNGINQLNNITDFVKRAFPTSVLGEHFGHRATYKIPSDDIKSLAKSFASLEQGKSKVGIVEYSFSQSTLEQVFLEFAKLQEDHHDKDESEESATRGDMLV